jgi:hypothetical protein
MADFQSEINLSLLSSTSLTSIFIPHSLPREKDFFYDLTQPLVVSGFP